MLLGRQAQIVQHMVAEREKENCVLWKAVLRRPSSKVSATSTEPMVLARFLHVVQTQGKARHFVPNTVEGKNFKKAQCLAVQVLVKL